MDRYDGTGRLHTHAIVHPNIADESIGIPFLERGRELGPDEVRGCVRMMRYTAVGAS